MQKQIKCASINSVSQKIKMSRERAQRIHDWLRENGGVSSSVHDVLYWSGFDPDPKEKLFRVKVVDSLGITANLLEKKGNVQPLKSWMGVSTNENAYPDDYILECARWADENTGGFTLLVSDWLQNYNWIAEHGGNVHDHELFFRDKHAKGVNRLARRRQDKLKQLFAKKGIKAEVVLWSEMLRKIVEQGQSSDVAGMTFLNVENRKLLESIYKLPDMSMDVAYVHRERVPYLIERSVTKGRHPVEVNEALQGYTEEEILLTCLMAKLWWANVKIGPSWEKAYDEISYKYLNAKFDGQEPSSVPFGAVYLEKV